MWFDGFESHRRPAGEVTVCIGGLREDPVPGTTDSLRQAAPATAVTADRLGTGHRTVVLRATGRQDSD